MTSVVDRLHGELRDLTDFLDTHGEPSLRIAADETFRKSMLLAAASYFETRVTEAIISYMERVSTPSTCAVAFVRNKGLKRQYHTLFNWEGRNANGFFALFGEEFRESMKAKVSADPDLDDSIKAFLSLGQERNLLVHQDFGSFPLEKTAEEIMALYSKALLFVESLPGLLDICSAGKPDGQLKGG